MKLNEKKRRKTLLFLCTQHTVVSLPLQSLYLSNIAAPPTTSLPMISPTSRLNDHNKIQPAEIKWGKVN